MRVKQGKGMGEKEADFRRGKRAEIFAPLVKL
jgi:hypothetical protein